MVVKSKRRQAKKKIFTNIVVLLLITKYCFLWLCLTSFNICNQDLLLTDIRHLLVTTEAVYPNNKIWITDILFGQV